MLCLALTALSPHEIASRGGLLTAATCLGCPRAAGQLPAMPGPGQSAGLCQQTHTLQRALPTLPAIQVTAGLGVAFATLAVRYRCAQNFLPTDPTIVICILSPIQANQQCCTCTMTATAAVSMPVRQCTFQVFYTGKYRCKRLGSSLASCGAGAPRPAQQASVK